ncbi:hypothetical protein LTR78_008802 [Recurvomyces mirabilis]|uniref:3-phytase n=1 Tax=Recurvomyces mirabilis TaxID=574656 RepID=A0AAE0TPY8_9PEZI|nr:hypothetical protein LTR78_008802 [Recurvomyces mirabilis]KAK5160960.1 hypothetical protein LTS14_000754 [Recurvomyces mirabilis]
MTTLTPRPAYSPAELEKLYPSNLELQQVQILLRHGERTPVGTRFQNAGLAPYWPYCTAARQLKDVVLNSDGTWDYLSWRRRLERLGPNDAPITSAGSRGEIDGVCEPGELTDLGRQTTLALGERIRNLYVNQLSFLPTTATVDTDNNVSLRATPIQRALESVQQAYTGLYPPTHRATALPPKTIVRRSIQDETLFPNESACPRFRELAKAFADRTAKVWNDGPEIRYLNSKLGKWMPEATPKVAVDGHPRLSGLMDTINATRAHGSATKLPKEFYEQKVTGYVDRICTEEWFVGYQESNEYRTLGIGALIGDLSQRMVEKVRANDVATPAVGAIVAGEGDFKLSMSGCHDTTIASALTALGAFDVSRDHWPNFTSNIAFELFRRKDALVVRDTAAAPPKQTQRPSWWSTLFSSTTATTSSTATLARTPLTDLPPTERQKLEEHYVRLRYNDQPITIPFCAAQKDRHLEGDESFCTLTAFKQAADSFTPKDWKGQCRMNLGAPAMGTNISRPPGWVDEEVKVV